MKNDTPEQSKKSPIEVGMEIPLENPLANHGSSSAIDLQAGPEDGQRKRLVVALQNGIEVFRDRIDTTRANSRKRFLGDLAGVIGRTSEDLACLNLALIRAADAADEQIAHTTEQQAKSKLGDVQPAKFIVDLASRDILFRNPSGDAYVEVAHGKYTEVYAVESADYRGALTSRYHDLLGVCATANSLRDAINTLNSIAKSSDEKHEVHVRVGWHDGKCYLDLADEERRVVVIDGEGWRLAEAVPLKFLRPRGLLPLAMPAHGGQLKDLRQFINVQDYQWPLVAGFLVGFFLPKGTFPVLAIYGEQGAAKSTFSKIIRSMVDPNLLPVRTSPQNERDLAIAAQNSAMLAFDNLSTIEPWLSDSLCRLVSGGGLSTRKLYSDSAETLLEFRRPVLLNAIEELGVRSDLLDRSILLTLKAIPSNRRKLESDLWRDFDLAKPAILGAILDSVAAAIRNSPAVKLAEMPRLADWVKFVVAAESALGLGGGTFLRSYQMNQNAANLLALEGSSLANEFLSFVSRRVRVEEPWSNTATALLEQLNRRIARSLSERTERKPTGWPSTPAQLSGKLRRIVPNLRKIGVDVVFSKSGERNIRISVTEKFASNFARMD